MADKYNNILKPLQEHELTPPAGAFEKAWENILLQKEGIDHNVESIKNAFEKLQQYSIQAPELNFQSLLAGEKKSTGKKQAVVISKNFKQVAAVLALVVTAAFIYMAMPKNDKTVNGRGRYAGAQEIKDQNNKETGSSLTADSAGNAMVSVRNKIPSPASGESGIKARNTKKDRKQQFGEQAKFYNNDLFFTLVNYKEYGKEKLFTKTIKEKRVTLNQYSYVNLSDKMVAMLQEVYLTKKNGKMARKAKRAKKKFEKWKKKDEEYFDKELGKNPADIIDLGGFLMKN